MNFIEVRTSTFIFGWVQALDIALNSITNSISQSGKAEVTHSTNHKSPTTSSSSLHQSTIATSSFSLCQSTEKTSSSSLHQPSEDYKDAFRISSRISTHITVPQTYPRNLYIPNSHHLYPRRGSRERDSNFRSAFGPTHPQYRQPTRYRGPRYTEILPSVDQERKLTRQPDTCPMNNRYFELRRQFYPGDRTRMNTSGRPEQPELRYNHSYKRRKEK
mmetsp:Transcript_21059/g.31393  ORF Transcript_21059/g.31393 Transcript_21059/m.31393 type:complete len:217 (+) Transcript_21059:161-811(+)